MADMTSPSDHAGEIDLRALGRAVWRRRWRILVVTVVVAVATILVVGQMSPRYRSEARVLIQNHDSVYTSPGVPNPNAPQPATALDAQEIGSQVQLILSRDVALAVIRETGLTKVSEFNPSHVSLGTRILVLLGLARDPSRMSDEARTLLHYYDALNAYQLPNSHVVAIDFVSKDSELAAKIANAVAAQYLKLQQSAKQISTRQASTWLAGEIETLRGRVAEAEHEVENFRSHSDLFIGANNAPVSQQQLGELTSQLAAARSQEADAQAKAEQIRAAIKSDNLNETLGIANSDVIRGLVQQRALMSAALARDSMIYLPRHPVLQQQRAQLAGLDRQIRDEALKLARGYEADAKLAASRVGSLHRQIEAQQQVAATANEQDIKLRALQRDAKAERDLLDQYLARYRDAVARENLDALPPDASVISAAVAASAPYFPKPVPIVILVTMATLMMMVGITAAGELMRRSSEEVLPAWSNPRARRTSEIAEGGIADPALTSEPDRALDEEVRPAVEEREEARLQQRSEPPRAADDPSPPDGTLAADEASSSSPRPVSSAAAAAGIALLPGSEAAEILKRLRAPGESRRAVPVHIEAADTSVVGALAEKLAAGPLGPDAMDILLIGTGPEADPGMVALSLAGALARAGRKAVVIDVAGQSPALADAAPHDRHAALSDLVAGRAGFGEVIHPAPSSPAHIVPHGSGEALRPENWPRLDVVFDALGLSYDFVLVAGPATLDNDTTLARLARRCRAAVIVTTGDAESPVSQLAHHRLAAEGINDVVVLTTPPVAAASEANTA